MIFSRVLVGPMASRGGQPSLWERGDIKKRYDLHSSYREEEYVKAHLEVFSTA